MQDPEKVHHRSTRLGVLLGRFSFTQKLLGLFFNYQHPLLQQTIAGITFPNPVGLAAGFDKDARLTQILPSIGFGFEEIGSVTGTPCAGNAQPRVFRLPKDEALVINYGLCSLGAEAIARNLRTQRFRFPIGVSIARANNADIVMDVEKGIADYHKAFAFLKDLGDYLTINISCPNTPADRAFSTPKIFARLMESFKDTHFPKPVFIKLKPDFSFAEVDAFIALADQYPFITGFIISNLTKDRRALTMFHEGMKGGISGKPLVKKSNDLITYVYKKTQGRYVLMGCGGIFTAEDAYEKIKAGASLVQLITGMIYEGPACIKKINKGLVALLKKDGYRNISEAIGVDAMQADSPLQNPSSPVN